MIKMKSKAHCPQLVPTVGEVLPDGIFEVSEGMADELEHGLFERVTDKKEVPTPIKPEPPIKEEKGDK